MGHHQFTDEMFGLRKCTNKITDKIFSLSMQLRLAANQFNSMSKNIALLFGVYF